MRRLSEMNVLTILTCLGFAVLLGSGCDAKSSKSGGNSNKSDSATKTPTHDDSSMSDDMNGDDHGGHATSDDSMSEDATSDDMASDDHDDHEGHDHEGHDHEAHDGDHDRAAPPADAVPAEADLVDLSVLKIERRPSGIKPTNRRDATGDMIFATVRVEMDKFLAQRQELLDSGVDPTDPEIRRREESIRKAVALLTENGEYVEPIIPPIEGIDSTEASANSGTSGN